MSTFVSVVKPEPAAYTSSFTRYVSFGAPAGVVEAAMGETMMSVTPSLSHRSTLPHTMSVIRW